MTKKQRRAKAQTSARKRRKAVAARAMLKAMNPARKYAGFKIKKNPGGSITIIPIKSLKKLVKR